MDGYDLHKGIKKEPVSSLTGDDVRGLKAFMERVEREDERKRKGN